MALYDEDSQLVEDFEAAKAKAKRLGLSFVVWNAQVYGLEHCGSDGGDVRDKWLRMATDVEMALWGSL